MQSQINEEKVRYSDWDQGYRFAHKGVDDITSEAAVAAAEQAATIAASFNSEPATQG